MTLIEDDDSERSDAQRALVVSDAVRSDYGDFTIDRKRLDILLGRNDFIPWGKLLPLIGRHLRLQGNHELSQHQTWELFVDEVCDRAPALVSAEGRIRVKQQDPTPVAGFAEALSLYMDVPSNDLMVAHMLQAQTGKEAEVHEDGTPRLEIGAIEAGVGLRGGADERRQAMATMIDPQEPVPRGASPYAEFERIRSQLRGRGNGRTD